MSSNDEILAYEGRRDRRKGIRDLRATPPVSDLPVLLPLEEQRPTYTAMRDVPPDERPRERLKSRGAGSLSIPELIAILWRTGTSGHQRESALSIAMRAVALHGGLSGLIDASLTDLERVHGVGPVKAIELKAALELARRVNLVSPDGRRVVRSPRDVADVVAPSMAHLTSEQLHVVLLSTKNHIVAVRELYRGTVNASVVRIAELFRDAIRENCPSIIIVHNHPSGDPTPSAEDLKVTTEAIAAGKILDISLVDHVIIGSQTLRWASIRDTRPDLW